ncbi:alcohol dehydrogenase catalytic domain-containing protein [Lentisphaerota bacterium ZTH]|nr:alcohol dehydrogenase catalytic domain-containing protein [Lentisphaerota bacterium]WET05574.1 alcohol dehydrogenase catalytic domain-containing protein [Lentisphaerota bacterium ZTH]
MSCKCDVPKKMLAWPLYGAGMEHLGKDDKPVEIDVPEPQAGELLVRIDAIGLCFSDVKLIRAGEGHPRVISGDLSVDPVIPGHEAVMTVVRVGDSLKSKFKCGQRFIIQANIYVNGKGFAFGYAIDGGMAQYSILDERVLNGDEGCYLLPVGDETPSAVAALMEPWTCVQASYMIENRTAPKQSGSMLIVAGEGSTKIYTAGELLKAATPARVCTVNLCEAAVKSLSRELEVEIESLDALPESGFDDLFICDCPRELAERAGKLGACGAVISFIGDYPDEEWAFDVGSIHYAGWFYQGAEGSCLAAAYNRNVRSSWKQGGVCWLPGGAGAMGQMHTQMAVESADGPARILVSDMDDTRIENVSNLLADTIEERGIEFKTVNPSKFTAEEFEKLLKDFAPDGFDDIVMLVPVLPVLNSSAREMAEDGLMNIFAGIPTGQEGAVNVQGIASRGMRFIGSSGSKTAHLRYTLGLAESGALAPVTALAAVGGMKALKAGLNAVINADFPGKTVIFPNCPDMPLTAINNISSLADDIEESLDNKGFYTLETECKLLEKFSGR